MSNKEILDIAKKGVPIYIWGAGVIGKSVFKHLENMGVSVNGYVTEISGGGGISPEELQSKHKEYAVIKGWQGAFFMSDEEIKSRFKGAKYIFTVVDSLDGNGALESIDLAYYESNKEKFLKFRDALADELSKKVFDAYIEAKTLRTNKSLVPLVIAEQYFFKDSPWEYFDDDILVDCGAFDGDSIGEFVKLRGNKYREIIALEPDDNNFEKLQQYVKDANLANVELIKVGAYNEKKTLKFKAAADSCPYLSGDGNITVAVDTIDNICANKPASIIKMDIEGSELFALQGAAKTIKNYKPLLMICVYHKRDDTFKIMDCINNITSGYKFYLRAHHPLPTEVVLYAVPVNRVKKKKLSPDEYNNGILI